MIVDQEDAGIAEITIESLRAEVARLREQVKSLSDNSLDDERVYMLQFGKVVDERDALRAVVQSIEWHDGTCPICGHLDYGGHAAYCALRAALEANK